jgi:16S rRNA G1207 methylase RsmC
MVPGGSSHHKKERESISIPTKCTTLGIMDERREHGAIHIRLGRPGKAVRKEAFLDGRIEVSSARGVRGPDEVFLEALSEEFQGRVLVSGTREALGALAVAKLCPSAGVTLFCSDAYEFSRAWETSAENAGNLEFYLGADLPRQEDFDWVVLLSSQKGDGMLAGELLRQAWHSLKNRGKAMVLIDNPGDRWMHARLLEVFGSATIHLRSPRGLCYIARKQAGLPPRERDFSRTFSARLLGRDLEIQTRPGVFSHGEIDEGTLALSESARLTETSRVVEIGCGSGALGIAAALGAPGGCALLVDSSARAVQAARRNVLRNGAGRNALVIFAYDLSAAREGAFDLALANPPYYSDFRIAESFVREAARVLAPGGEIHLVTKAPDRSRLIVEASFGDSTVIRRRGYFVVQAVRKPS